MKTFPHKYFWAGLTGIVLVYSLYYLLARDTDHFYTIPRKLRHVYKFLAVVWVYVAGTWALEKMNYAWMIGLWHGVHLVLIGFLVLLGLVDWVLVPLSFEWKHVGASLHEFLISPVLYVLMVVVNYRLNGLGE